MIGRLLDRYGHLLGPHYVLPAVYLLGLCAFIGWLWMTVPASFWVVAALFLRWLGVAMGFMSVGAYLTGGPRYQDDHVNKLQWGAFLFGIGLGWFFRGPFGPN